MATATELLTAVETAIETRLAGGAVQSYTVNGVNIAKASLQELSDMRDRLRREVARGTMHGRVYADRRGYT